MLHRMLEIFRVPNAFYIHCPPSFTPWIPSHFTFLDLSVKSVHISMLSSMKISLIHRHNTVNIGGSRNPLTVVLVSHLRHSRGGRATDTFEYRGVRVVKW